MNNNILARFFDWMGDALERFNPSAFRFLAAALPYLTPIPVAWMTAKSASIFLKFTPEVAFILVFSLEGIGLWFTTMFVDAVVDWVRSRNWKSFVPVVLFFATVTAYVMILVSLNVTLEEASGNINPALSRVITLFCFLPLITGIGNGYYKLKLEHKTETQKAMEHDAQVAERKRIQDLEFQERNRIREMELQERIRKQELEMEERKRTQELEFRKEKWKQKHENGSSNKINGTQNGSSKTSKIRRKTSRTPSANQQRVFAYLEQELKLRGEVPSFTEVMEKLEIPQSTASRLRNEWIDEKQ